MTTIITDVAVKWVPYVPILTQLKPAMYAFSSCVSAVNV